MSKTYDLVFDLITEMSGNYGRDRVERVAVRETQNFYFVKLGDTESRYPKLINKQADGCVSDRPNKEMSTSSSRLFEINSPKAVAIRHERKMRLTVEKINEELNKLLNADNKDPRILEIAETLGIKV